MGQPQTQQDTNPTNQWPLLAVNCAAVRYNGEQIRQARLRAGMTLGDLADAVQVGVRTVTRWQRVGIGDDNHLLAKVEQVLALNPDNPAPNAHIDDERLLGIVRAVVAVTTQATTTTTAPHDLRALPDAALWALAQEALAILQRRFWTHSDTQPAAWPGSPLTPPAHLDVPGTSHDRAEGDR